LLKRLQRLTELLPVSNEQSLYQLLTAQCRHSEEWLNEAGGERNNSAANSWKSLPDLLHKMMYQDFTGYLPDEVLVKVDRAAMSVSLETRIPLLDHRIIEFAWSLPACFKQRRTQGKWLLRQVLHSYVPAKLVERPKQGFAAPVEEWLRKELRPWAEDLLDERRLRRDGFFRADTIRQKWKQHSSGLGDWGRPLWNVLMFQGWWEVQKNTAVSNSISPAHPAGKSFGEPILAA
jgi:asparagine synthase (glutamine-hydrolysing)